MNDERLKKNKRYDEAYRAALEEIERQRKELQAAAPSEDSSPLEWLRHQDSVYEPLRQRRTDRKAAIVDADVLRDWVRISEIVRHWADDKKLTFGEACQEVGHRIVIDSAEGRLGTEEAPALMLLSEGFDEKDESNKTHTEKGFLFSPLGLENIIRNAFGDTAPDVRAKKTAEFLTDHGWIYRAAAAPYLGKPILPPSAQTARKARDGDPIRRRGKPLQFDWDAVRVSAKEEFDKRGDFELPKNQTDGWRSQADLERIIQAALAQDSKDEYRAPALNTVRIHLAKWLKEWRATSQ